MKFLSRKIAILAGTIAVLAVATGALYLLSENNPRNHQKAESAQERLLDIREVTSPGGIKAWLVQDDTLPLITLRFAFRGAGAINDPVEKQGLSRLISNTLDEGAGERDAQAFQKTLDDNSIQLSFTSSRDDFFGSVKTLTKSRDLAFSLLHDALTNPRLEAEAIERMRAANIARVKSSLADPGWMAARLLNDVAFTGHPYALNSGGTVATLSAITDEDMRSFVKAHMTRDRVVVAVTGDITPGQLGAMLDRVFGDLQAAGPSQEAQDIPAPKGRGETILYRHDAPQTMIEIMMPGIGRNDPDYSAFQVANLVFGGGGFGSRLMEEIREKRGLTYGVYSSPYLLDHIKALNISLSTENRNAGAVMDIIRTETARMRDMPVSAQELADAKSYITGSLPLGLTSTDGISDLMLGLQLDDMPSTYLDSYPDIIKAVTIEDIQRVAQRVFNPDIMTVIMVGKPDDIKPTRTTTILPNAE